jgi:hypothetical protein
MTMRLFQLIVAAISMTVGFVGAAVADHYLPIVVDLRVSPHTGKVVWYVILLACVAIFYGVIGWLARGVARPIRTQTDEDDRPTWPQLATTIERYDEISGVRRIDPSAPVDQKIFPTMRPPRSDTKPSRRPVSQDEAMEWFLTASEASMRRRNTK